GVIGGLAAVPAPLAAEWLTVPDESLVVARGSALDFSGLSAPGPAGVAGRVIVGASGALSFAQAPDRRARLNCASIAWSPATGGFPDHRTADLYAEQLRIHGYNLVRFHYVEATLMTDRKGDFDFDPEALDRFRYFLAALKRQGIYWVFDVLTSPNGARGDVFPHRWVEKHDLKLEVYVDDGARRHWRRLAETLLGAVNPHTGIRPLDDPALALVVLANENGLEFLSLLQSRKTGQAYPDKLRPAFNAWLRKTYPNEGALKAAWGGLETGESLGAGTVHFPRDRFDPGPRMRDKQRFFLDLEAETFGWMERELRSLGYRGLVTSYNNWGSTAADLTRGQLSVVARHGYFDEVLGYEPGESITQRSSLDDEAGYVRSLAAARWLGRPFVVTEYGHPFWNRFRREAGLVLPAYAALQGWDFVCRHAEGAIDLSTRQSAPRKRQLTPYGIGLDPVARAGETLAALLFHRGDVAPARGVAAIPLGGERDLVDQGQGDWPADLTTVGLMTKLGLVAPPAEASTGSPRLVLTPAASEPQ
ncbi:MAG: GH148, partial [uncultured Microvirga sp.]